MMPPSTEITKRSEHKAWGGVQCFFEHASVACAGPMRFAVYLPPAARVNPVPALYFLAGLTCTEETFAIKSGAHRIASELGLAIVTCDTSPRVARFPGDAQTWDLGQGAGFYLDATQEPWSAAYRMRSYVTSDLRVAVETNLPIRRDCRGIFGHSMGGHGALTIALSFPEDYRSVSAFSPIVAPTKVPWGVNAFKHYLGPKSDAWDDYDATALVQRRKFDGTILIDQGTQDPFLDRQLRPEVFATACETVGQDLRLRMQDGYDHSYYFISTFIEDHLRHHARVLIG